jgi:hypothetical protein
MYWRTGDAWHILPAKLGLVVCHLIDPHYCNTLATSASSKYKGKKSSWSSLWYRGWKVWRGVWGCRLSQTLQSLGIFLLIFLQLFNPWLFVSLLNLSSLLTKYSTGQECAAGARTIRRFSPSESQSWKIIVVEKLSLDSMLLIIKLIPPRLTGASTGLILG